MEKHAGGAVGAVLELALGICVDFAPVVVQKQRQKHGCSIIMNTITFRIRD